MDQGDWMGIATLLAFIAFVGVCVWAWSDKRKAGFEEAANLPFVDEPAESNRKGGSDD